MPDDTLHLLRLQVITLVHIVLKNIFQSVLQRERLGKEETRVFAQAGYHKDTLTVLRYAVLLGIEDLEETCIALVGKPFAPLVEVLGKLPLCESLDILHEQPLGMLGRDSVGTSPQTGRARAATLRKATLTASRGYILAWKRVSEQVEVGNLQPVNVHDVSEVGGMVAMNGTVGSDGVLVNLGNADHRKAEVGKIVGKPLEGDRLRAVTCKGFKDTDCIVAHVMMN